MNVLITGGCGFIGSYLAKDLISQGHHVVLTDFAIETSLIMDILPQVTVLRLDVTDHFGLIHAINENKITHIVHLVSLLTPESQKNPFKALQINSLGLFNILEAARLEKIQRVVWSSSTSVYGPFYDSERELTELDFTNAESVYSACKQYNEIISLNYFKEFGVDVIALRFPVVYGYGRRTGSSIFTKNLIEDPVSGKNGQLSYREDQEINWQYITDTANSIVLALKALNPKHRILNIPGEIKTFGEFAQIVQKYYPEIRFTFGTQKVDWPSRINGDLSFKTIGYKPKISVEAGILDYLRIMKAV